MHPSSSPERLTETPLYRSAQESLLPELLAHLYENECNAISATPVHTENIVLPEDPRNVSSELCQPHEDAPFVVYPMLRCEKMDGGKPLYLLFRSELVEVLSPQERMAFVSAGFAEGRAALEAQYDETDADDYEARSRIATMIEHVEEAYDRWMDDALGNLSAAKAA